ncbi:MAG: hypothetical protein ACLGI3_15675 [Actinomycetes bacterium]
MGWGCEPHEGVAARKLPDGTLTSSWTADTTEFVAFVARCSCGWEGGSHPPTEEGADAAYGDWWDNHWGPKVTPAPDRLLELRRDGGGRRHFLAGRAVHCGTPLELLLPGTHWVAARYETDGRGEPMAYVILGGPWEHEEAADEVTAPMRLPANASLRWPGR